MKKFFNITFSLITVTLLLFSCAQAPTPKVSYYLLNAPEHNLAGDNEQTVVGGEHKVAGDHKIILDNVILPQYLKQSSIVMLMNENQLHYARYHLWGESLQQGITKLIKQALTITNKQQSLHLTIEIDHFYPTDQTNVILSGRYWLSMTEAEVKNNQYVFNFAFKQALKADGYGQAVKQMHVLIKQLAAQINQHAVAFNSN